MPIQNSWNGQSSGGPCMYFFPVRHTPRIFRQRSSSWSSWSRLPLPSPGARRRRSGSTGRRACPGGTGPAGRRRLRARPPPGQAEERQMTSLWWIIILLRFALSLLGAFWITILFGYLAYPVYIVRVHISFLHYLSFWPGHCFWWDLRRWQQRHRLLPAAPCCRPRRCCCCCCCYGRSWSPSSWRRCWWWLWRWPLLPLRPP